MDEGGPGNNFEALARLYLVMSIIALRREDRYFAAAGLLHGVSKDDKHGIPWDTLRRVISALLAHAEGHDDRARTIAAPVLARPGAAVAHAVLAELYRVLEEPASAAQALRLATSGALPRYARASTLVTAAALRSSQGMERTRTNSSTELSNPQPPSGSSLHSSRTIRSSAIS